MLEDIVTTIVSGPLDVIGGIIIGLVWALLCALLPNKDDVSVNYFKAFSRLQVKELLVEL